MEWTGVNSGWLVHLIEIVHILNVYTTQADDGRQKLDTLTAALSMNIEERCQCGFTVMNILQPKFLCFAESQDAVTYRTEIIGTGVVSPTGIATHIHNWIASGSRVTFDFILIAVDSSCQVLVTTILDPECNNPTIIPPTSSTSTTSNTEPTSSATPQVPLALLGGVLGGVLLLIIGALAVVTIALVCCQVYRRKTSGKMELTKERCVLCAGLTDFEST